MGSNKQAKNVNNAYDQEYEYLTGRSMAPKKAGGVGGLFGGKLDELQGKPPNPNRGVTTPQAANQHGVGGIYGDLYDDTWNRRTAADERSGRAYDDVYSGYSNILGSGTGGLDPSRVGQIDKYIGDYYNFAQGNTVSDADRSRIRGGGVYDEFSKTGGLSEGDRANIRSRGTSGIPAFYTSLRNDMDRRNVASGGYNPGFNAQTKSLAREQARAGQGAALDTELGIMDQVNSGRRWGAEGMTSSESALQNLLSQNFISGMGGASGLQMNLADSIRSGNMGALEGISNLRSQVPGESAMYNNMLLQILGQRDSSVQGITGQKAAYNPNQSWFDKYGMPLLQGGAAIGGTLLGGPAGGAGARTAVGGLGGRRPTAPKYGPQNTTYA